METGMAVHRQHVGRQNDIHKYDHGCIAIQREVIRVPVKRSVAKGFILLAVNNKTALIRLRLLRKGTNIKKHTSENGQRDLDFSLPLWMPRVQG
jgi:hypothetical protein